MLLGPAAWVVVGRALLVALAVEEDGAFVVDGFAAAEVVGALVATVFVDAPALAETLRELGALLAEALSLAAPDAVPDDATDDAAEEDFETEACVVVLEIDVEPEETDAV
ncbi:hypothetical protein HD598_001845 [Neomicrococcus aestuarii]|uniref:Uncharacterized protein n=1 Tax=Neomicrococcus aestuarii TaxID=556325 RepID=A0A7W8TUT1_9MICC|nr:hypothetical protein [Neomicrococcus aestuarii]MBB5513158.1 hypothetical protein [Neomicrococcus aestuarii]